MLVIQPKKFTKISETEYAITTDHDHDKYRILINIEYKR